ncbi:septum formation initiator family protein [Panacagrimonas sp.]|uniref:septum formation initiator family protein n=1 Tax=Panacagrimonas sp. TaxID=2480088 RepID=UPI003B51D067
MSLKHAITAVLGLLFLGLQGRLWISDDGLRSQTRLQHQVESAQAENRQLAVRNTELEAEVQDLKSGQASVEARARTTLGMIRPDETFFLVVQ